MATEKMSCGRQLIAHSGSRELHVPHLRARNVSCPRDTDGQLLIQKRQEEKKRTRCSLVFTPIAQLVPRMMNVLSRSSAESTKEAVRDIEDE